MNNIKKIAIVGGNGGMGAMFKRFLSTLPEYQVTTFEKQHWHDPSTLQQQDIVLISTPIDVTLPIIKQVSQWITPETILCDFTSTKTAPLAAMLEHHSGPVVGLHPIFGPHIPNAEEQVIVCCEGRKQEQYQWLIEDIQSIGFVIEPMSAAEHDKAMDFIQGIEHFSTFCLGKFLKDQQVDLESLRKISSPVYKFELNLLGRLFDQNPSLYADIIMSDQQRIDCINAFVDCIIEQSKQLADNRRNQFIENFEAIKQWMGPFTEKAYKESDDLLNKQPK